MTTAPLGRIDRQGETMRKGYTVRVQETVGAQD